MAQLFKIDSKGVHAGEGSNTRNTTSNPTFESSIPTHFHINTTLPSVVNYNPSWVQTSAWLLNGAQEVDAIKIKKVGAHVFIEGCLTIPVSSSSPEYPISFMYLPPAVRPQYDHYVCAYTESTNSVASLRFAADGIAYLEIVGQYASITTSGATVGMQTGTITFGVSTDYWCAYDEKLEEVQMPAFDVLYDGGPAHGLLWKQATGLSGLSSTSYTFSINSSGTLYLTSSSGSSPRSFITLRHIMLPDSATAMNISAKGLYTSQYFSFGLIDEEENRTLSWGSNAAINLNGTANSGVTSALSPSYAQATSYTTKTLDITGLNHNKFYTAVIGVYHTGTSSSYGRTHQFNKVWFT